MTKCRRPPASIPRLSHDLPVEIGHDAADMARLDDEALVWVAGKGRWAEAPFVA